MPVELFFIGRDDFRNRLAEEQEIELVYSIDDDEKPVSRRDQVRVRKVNSGVLTSHGPTALPLLARRLKSFAKSGYGLADGSRFIKELSKGKPKTLRAVVIDTRGVTPILPTIRAASEAVKGRAVAIFAVCPMRSMDAKAKADIHLAGADFLVSTEEATGEVFNSLAAAYCRASAREYWGGFRTAAAILLAAVLSSLAIGFASGIGQAVAKSWLDGNQEPSVQTLSTPEAER